MNKFVASFALCFVLLPIAHAEQTPIKHRFLAMDESRQKLHYVDEADPAKSWNIEFPGRYRDVQLVGNSRVLISALAGYREYDFKTRGMVKEVADPRYAGTMSVRRMANGHTVVCCAGGKRLVELDAADKVVREATFAFDHVRLVRLTPRGTVLTGSVKNRLAEVSLDGKILHELESPDSNYIYQGLRLPGGNLLVSTGYKCTLEEYDSAGKCVWKAGGKPAPAGLFYQFFGGFQVLKSGDIVVSTWTGHGAQDSAKGQQIIQFNRKGGVVWKWHDPDRAGSIHGIIVLDDLNAEVLNDDLNGVLQAVKQ